MNNDRISNHLAENIEYLAKPRKTPAFKLLESSSKLINKYFVISYLLEIPHLVFFVHEVNVKIVFENANKSLNVIFQRK